LSNLKNKKTPPQYLNKKSLFSSQFVQKSLLITCLKAHQSIQNATKMPRLFIVFFSLILCGLSSCVSHQELINFRSGKEKEPTLSKLPKQDIANKADLKLQANDILALIITSPDPILSAPYNLTPPQLSAQVTTASSPNSFLIGSDGMVNIPSIGAIKAAGLTINELREEVLKKVSVYLENPSVNIRLLNFTFSVSGEVTRPGRFTVFNERITILEALSEAGDLTPYSNRQHIMVIREHDGVREYGEINLKDTQFFTSPYYYLQRNDVIYVEPTKSKIAQIQQPVNTYLQPIQVGIGLTLSIITILALFKK
jgi:polysaccharide biosynthesis/export protein